MKPRVFGRASCFKAQKDPAQAFKNGALGLSFGRGLIGMGNNQTTTVISNKKIYKLKIRTRQMRPKRSMTTMGTRLPRERVI